MVASAAVLDGVFLSPFTSINKDFVEEGVLADGTLVSLSDPSSSLRPPLLLGKERSWGNPLLPDTGIVGLPKPGNGPADADEVGGCINRFSSC